MLQKVDVKNLPQMLDGIRIIVSKKIPSIPESDYDYWLQQLTPPDHITTFVNDERRFKYYYRKALFSKKITILILKRLNQLSNDYQIYIAANYNKPYSDMVVNTIISTILNIKKYLPENIICPYILIDDIFRRCWLKLKISPVVFPPTRTGKKIPVQIKRVPGHPQSCDFIWYDKKDLLPRTPRIKDCLLLQQRKGYYTCKTCLFYYYGLCLRKKIRIKNDLFSCPDYVEKELRFGNTSLIARIKLWMEHFGKDIKQLREIWTDKFDLHDKRLLAESVLEVINDEDRIVISNALNHYQSQR